MSASPGFRAFLQELLGALGELRFRAMFGGHGVYLHDRMFALVVRDTLYLKGFPDTVADFEAAGSEMFTYAMKDGRTGSINYWRMPESALDDPDEAVDWARRAVR